MSEMTLYPANICWSSRHVLRTSWTRLQRNNFTSSKMSWRRLAKTSWRRLEDDFKTFRKTFWRLLEDVFKTSWKTKNCYAEDVFKTSWRHFLKKSWRHVLKTYWRHIFKTSSRCFGGKQNFYWWYLYLTNLNVYLTNLCFTNLYLTNLRQIQNASLRTQQFRFSSYFETRQHFYFKN